MDIESDETAEENYVTGAGGGQSEKRMRLTERSETMRGVYGNERSVIHWMMLVVIGG